MCVRVSECICVCLTVCMVYDDDDDVDGQRNAFRVLFILPHLKRILFVT